MFYVYVLKSLKDEELYIGSTNNLKRRFAEHQNGKSFSTKFRLPFELIYYEAYKKEKDALIREQSLKLRGNARRFLKERIKESLSAHLN
jgi:putative endonuclease